jgi:hypothetical protein
LGMQAFYCSEMEESAKSREGAEKKHKSVFRF